MKGKKDIFNLFFIFFLFIIFFFFIFIWILRLKELYVVFCAHHVGLDILVFYIILVEHLTFV